MTKKYKTFRTGNTVSWKSQAHGCETTKTGRVVAVVPANTGVSLAKYLRNGYISHYGGGFPRNHVTYLVEVQDGKGNMHIYWPRVSALESQMKAKTTKAA